MTQLITNTPATWTRQECTQERIDDRYIAIFKELVGDYASRNLQAESDKSVLTERFWYQSAYALHLKSHNQLPRLNFLKKNHSFYHGYPPKCFTMVADQSCPSGKTPMHFVLKKDKTATEGLKSLEEDFSMIDCATIIYIAAYKVLHEVVGEEKFNSLFDPNGPTPMILNPKVELTPLKNFYIVELTKEHRKGSISHIRNVPSYGVKHPDGEAAGFNVLCIDENEPKKFTAFGVDPNGVTEAGLIQVLVDEFNKTPISPTDLYTPEAAQRFTPTLPYPETLIQMIKSSRTTLAEFQMLTQQTDQAGWINIRNTLDAEKIKKHL